MRVDGRCGCWRCNPREQITMSPCAIGRFCCWVLCLTVLATVAFSEMATADDASLLMVCGGNEIFIIDAAAPGPPSKLWTWRAKDRDDLPEPMRGLFNSTDEC